MINQRFLIGLLSILFAACANNRTPTVPITPPWDKVTLPLKEDARVRKSNDTLLIVEHNDPWRDVSLKYMDALEASGWSLTKQPLTSEHAIILEMKKTGQNIMVDVSDDDNTLVRIEKIPAEQ